MKKLKRGTAVVTALALALAVALPVNAVPQKQETGVTVQSVGKLTVNQDYAYCKGSHKAQATSAAALRREESALPAHYDLRSEGRVTPVKDQKSSAICWAFGAISSAESNLLTQLNGRGTAFPSDTAAGQAIDLSEKHLAWFAFHGQNSGAVSQYAGADTFTTDNAFQTGGSRVISGPTLARWYGAVDETQLPFTTNAAGTPTQVTDTALQTVSNVHLKNVDYLPETVIYDLKADGTPGPITFSESGRTALKQALQAQGVVSVGYHSPVDSQELGQYYKASTAGYCCDDAENISANHEVSIVGWDDNYSADNFTQKPQGNGAWLVKNSWGSSTTWSASEAASRQNQVGEDGYFYLSYYDITLNNPTSFQMEDTAYAGTSTHHTYDQIYQYDGVGMGAGEEVSPESLRFANVFTARSKMRLQAVSTQTTMPNATVQIDIYTDPQTGNPASGRHMASVTRTLTDAGYYTIDLGMQSLGVQQGQRFSVVEQVKAKYNNGTCYQVLLETGDNAISSDAVSADIACAAGQSYYYGSDGKWQDQSDTANRVVVNGYTTGNATIKAFGNAVSSSTTAPDTTQVTLNDGTVKTVTPSDTIEIPTSGTYRVVFHSQQNIDDFSYNTGNGNVLQTGTVSSWDGTGGTYLLYAHGAKDQEAGVFVNGNLLFKAKITARPLSTDTSVDFDLKPGQSYTFRVHPDQKPASYTFNTANGGLLQTAVVAGLYPDGYGNYYGRVRAAKAYGGRVGVYCSINGASYKLFSVGTK